jgi:hypothetical protein
VFRSSDTPPHHPRPEAGRPAVWRPARARRAVHQTSLYARAALAARRRRAAGHPDELEALAGERLYARLSELPADVVSGCRLIKVPGNRPPWVDTGIDVRAGELVTTFASGHITMSRFFDIWFGPDFQLWARVGDNGPVFRGTRASNSFSAASSGRLFLASYFPGVWADPSGRLAGTPSDYDRVHGELSAIVVRWAPGVHPRTGLAQVATDAPGDLAAAEMRRLDDHVRSPDGWKYAWQLGDAEMWSDSPAEDGVICCHTKGDVGVVQYDVDVPVTEGTRFRWRWCIDSLPSLMAEDITVTHDYTSIALEFDNGQDISYFWSAELPVGYTFRCPVPGYTQMETHVALRSGAVGLGNWHAEDRGVLEDYRRAVGHPPARIVRVWLIAVSLFQRHSGESQFADIELVTDRGTVQVTGDSRRKA